MAACCFYLPVVKSESGKSLVPPPMRIVLPATKAWIGGLNAQKNDSQGLGSSARGSCPGGFGELHRRALAKS